MTEHSSRVISSLLDAAEYSAAKADWGNAAAMAREVLALDPSNEAARRILGQSNRHYAPRAYGTTSYAMNPAESLSQLLFRAKWAKWTIGITIGLFVLSILSTFLEIQMLQDMRDVNSSALNFVNQDRIDSNDIRQGMLALVILAVYIGSIVAVMRWLKGAVRNLPEIGSSGGRFTPGWAVGWFFIPIMNFVRPIQILGELWRGSTTSESNMPWKEKSMWPGIGWFWAIHLVSGFVGWWAVPPEDYSDPDTYLTADYIAIFSDFTGIAAGLLLFQIVSRITDFQTAKYRQLLQSDSPQPTEYDAYRG